MRSTEYLYLSSYAVTSGASWSKAFTQKPWAPGSNTKPSERTPDSRPASKWSSEYIAEDALIAADGIKSVSRRQMPLALWCQIPQHLYRRHRLPCRYSREKMQEGKLVLLNSNIGMLCNGHWRPNYGLSCQENIKSTQKFGTNKGDKK